MTVANLSDLSKDPTYAGVSLWKSTCCEQRNEYLQQQIDQTNTSHNQLQQLTKWLKKNHKLYEKVLELIEKQKRLIHRLYGQKKEGITARQTHLNYEAAQET